MEFKPNEITPAQAAEVVRKFKEYNKGVVILKPAYSTPRNLDEVSAKWSQIVDSKYCNITQITNKMKEIFKAIRNTPEDSVIGDSTVAFVHKTERNQQIPFYFTDLYIFCREAVKYRKETEEYKKKLAQLEKDEEFVLQNTPKDKLITDVEARIAATRAELGIETPQSSVAQAEDAEPA